jgi:four helix bundle protein
MFDALEVTLKFLEQLVPLETRIRQRSASLGKQLSDASESISLNLGEAQGRRGGDKRHHYEMAHGSACETTTALRVAVAKRYITADELAAIDVLLDRVRAMLWRLTH